MTDRELFRAAVRARENAYAPYSGFAVGAALLAASGKVYLGCNVENRAFSPTICAERAAFARAIVAGERKLVKLAVAGGKDEVLEFCPPCGVCRQVIAEFCTGDFPVLLGKGEDEIGVYRLNDLLPHSF